MGAGADAGECSGNGALAARNRDAGRVAGNPARVIFTPAISDQGCVICCRDSRTYLLAMRIRFSGCVRIPAQPILASKPFSGADRPEHDQFVVRFLPDLPSAALPNTSRAWRFGEPPELKDWGRVEAHVNDNSYWVQRTPSPSVSAMASLKK
jgi:hypothetical protein